MWKAGMWHVDHTHDTLITTGNGGQKDARVAISLFYGDTGVYEMPEKLLLPGEQTWVNLEDLIRHQIADKNGRVIPPGVMEGSYEIRDLDAKGAGYLYEGKTITDKAFGHATYGCAECCMQSGPGFNSFDILDNPVYGGVGDRYQFYAAASDLCSGLYGDVGASDWSSSNTSVGTIDYTGNMSFVGLGTATVRASSRLSSVNNCCCRPQTFFSSATATVSPRFNVAYSDYIPVDHVNGPTSCTYQSTSFTKIYMGDANRSTFRTTESIFITPDLQQSTGFAQDTGQTRNYGAGSPANGSTLSAADEDNVALDCLLWNNVGKATPAFSHSESYPSANHGQVHFWGSAANPLEDQSATINWDMTVLLDDSNPSFPTAVTTYTHTCYPSHQVKVNGGLAYSYPASCSATDTVCIFNCLFLHIGTVSGSYGPVPVNGN